MNVVHIPKSYVLSEHGKEYTVRIVSCLMLLLYTYLYDCFFGINS